MNSETAKTESNPIHPNYDEFKKNRPIWTTTFRRGIEYFLFRFGLFLGRKLSLSKLQNLGRGLGKIAYIFLQKDRGIVESQLKLVYPDQDSNAKRHGLRHRHPRRTGHSGNPANLSNRSRSCDRPQAPRHFRR